MHGIYLEDEARLLLTLKPNGSRTMREKNVNAHNTGIPTRRRGATAEERRRIVLDLGDPASIGLNV